MAGDDEFAVDAAVPPVETEELKGAAFLFRALSSRNYRLFFSGQLVSLIGTWLTNTATTWLVYRLTDKSTVLGLVNFAGQIPAFVFSPIAGVLVDRTSLYRVLLWTQTLSMLESFGLAILAFVTVGFARSVDPHTTTLAVGVLLALAAFQGMVNAFDIPARQSFVIQLVENRADLPNAIALNSSMFNTARLVGPAIAGYLIYKVGEGWCFTLDGVSYLAVLIALLLMRLPQRLVQRKNQHIVTEFKEGLNYAAAHKPIRSILLFVAGMSLCSMPQMVLMPVYAKNILHGDARTQGLLTAAMAVGAIVGVLLLAGRKSVNGLGRVMPATAAGLGLMLMVFAFSQALWLSIAAMVGVGFCLMTQRSAGLTLIQTLVDDEKRGRVMSFFTMAFVGVFPIGALLIGILAEPDRLGPQMTTKLCGIACILCAAWFTTQLSAIHRAVYPVLIPRASDDQEIL